MNSIDHHLLFQAINCLYVKGPDCEVIIRSLKNPMQSVKTNVVLAMLLYQSPSGISIFCFDGDYLKAPMKVLVLSLLKLLSFVSVIF